MKMNRLASDASGQGGLDVGTILGIIGILVAVIVGALVYSEVSSAMEDAVAADSLGDNIRKDVDDVAETIFTLMPILVMVAVILSLFVIFAPARQ